MKKIYIFTICILGTNTMYSAQTPKPVYSLLKEHRQESKSDYPCLPDYVQKSSSTAEATSTTDTEEPKAPYDCTQPKKKIFHTTEKK